MNAPTPTEEKTSEPVTDTIAIVGGGITGLFCAYVLASKGRPVELFESSDQLGGRIRSFLLRRNEMDECARAEHNRKPHPIKDGAVIKNLHVAKGDGEYEDLEFCAEFGPMRIELDVQVLLKFLLKHLGIGENPNPKTDDPLEAAYLEPFPQFSSPTSEADPLYQLRPDEEGKNPLELMVLAMCRAIVHISIDDRNFSGDDKAKYEGCGGYKQKHEELIGSLRDAAALQEPIGPAFNKWAKKLREDDYWLIARYGRIFVGDADTPVPLHAMGFWNLMSIYLSHNALTKVRDLGTFYHLLPENPNAAHWLTWQLRQLSISGDLQGIYGGMQAITEKLLDKMQYDPNTGICLVGTVSISLHLNAHVSHIERSNDGQLHLVPVPGKTQPCAGNAYRRVILALPKAPAHELVMASPQLKLTHNSRNVDLPEMLDSSFGFPMVKAFFVVRDRWWEETKRANWFATRLPTREVHYWKSRDPKSRRGMVMLYTDRPASSFWANYVPAGHQKDVEELCVPEDKTDENRVMIRARLKQRLVQYINENRVPDITEADIIWCGIMDWGRLPYGAGNHAWRPERKFWETIADLGDITFDEGEVCPHVHICGEAFTDYTGFIEGSLRSATYTLTKILRRDHPTTGDLLDDIFGVLKIEQLTPTFRDREYLDDLGSWIDNLDGSRQK